MMTRRLLCFAILAGLLVATPAAAEGTSRSTFMKLMEVQELWGEDKYDQAMDELQALARKTEGTHPYDFAITQQYIAHTAMLADRFDLARPALEKALAVEDLPTELVASLKLDYGQIIIGDEEYELARSMLEDWYATTQLEKQPSQIFSLAYANYMTGRLPRAEELIERALAAATSVNNSWYRIYYQVLFDQKKYDDAEEVIYGLASRDPGNEQYWRLLANHHLQMEESPEALAAMAISQLQGFYTQPDELRRLASMYGFVEIPEKAARLLEGWVGDGTIDADADTLRRIGDLWLLARERNRAMEYLDRAAAAAADGRTYELLASLHFEDEEWVEAHKAFLQALAAGGLEDAARVQLLAGISAYRAGMTDAARDSLEQAKASSKYRSQAINVLRRLNES
jgi:tetratricopeptide (TPR) repeat protein